MIKRLAFTVYPVTNLEKSRHFYEKVLGLTCTETFGDSWFEYDIGGTCFAITSYTMPKYEPGKQGSIAFEVSDLDAMIRSIESHGFKQAMDKMDTPVCRGAFFNDPDGNLVGLHQTK